MRSFWRAFAVSAVVMVLLPGVASAQQTLACGVPVTQFLGQGSVDHYTFSAPAGAQVLLQRADVSGQIGLIRLAIPQLGEDVATCKEFLSFKSPGGTFDLEVSDCIDDPDRVDEGPYTVTMQIVSDSADNCSQPLDCGTTSDGIGLDPAGEVDAYSFSATEGEQVDLALTDLSGEPQQYRLKVFDPQGVEVPGSGSCAGTLAVDASQSGRYTVLVSACSRPETSLYRLAYYDTSCPEGPLVTYFGVARADGTPLEPDANDLLGRPVYTRMLGHGLVLVVEGRPGEDNRSLGLMSVDNGLPDLQTVVSRPLGDGNPTVCDIAPPLIGGVPGVPSLDFGNANAAAINDLGCRFDDGQGNPLGRENSLDACTRSNDQFGFGFVDRTSTTQFCATIADAWSFPPGDTVVAARLRDRGGAVGAKREIVVRVFAPTPTPTSPPTPTPFLPTPDLTATSRSVTRTPGTPTPTRVPGPCAADCNQDGSVAINELVAAVDISLSGSGLESCAWADEDGNGRVDVPDLVLGIGNALLGCR
jgi:hypothetical protein